MAFELILLGALIFIFIVSFCGLLQKIKQTYERERVIAAQIIAERIARRREHEQSDRRSGSFSEIYINPAFATEAGGIFPGGPPPYTNYYLEPPPKYDDVVKVHHSIDVPAQTASSTETIVVETRNTTHGQNPPPYTVVIPPTATT